MPYVAFIKERTFHGDIPERSASPSTVRADIPFHAKTPATATARYTVASSQRDLVFLSINTLPRTIGNISHTDGLTVAISDVTKAEATNLHRPRPSPST